MDLNQDDVQQAMAPAMDPSADSQSAANAADSQSAPTPGPAIGDPDNPLLASVAAAPGTSHPMTTGELISTCNGNASQTVSDMWKDSQAIPGQMAGAMMANQTIAEANASVNASKVGADFKSGNMLGMLGDTASLATGLVSDEASMIGSGARAWRDGGNRVALDPMTDIVGGDSNAIFNWITGRPAV